MKMRLMLVLLAVLLLVTRGFGQEEKEVKEGGQQQQQEQEQEQEEEERRRREQEWEEEKRFNRPLVQAAKENQTETILALLEQGEDPNQQSKGAVALHLAIINSNLPVVRSLFLHGADPNVPNQTGESPAMIAIMHEENDIIREIMTHPSFNISTKTPFGYNILHIAAQRGSLLAVQLLDARGFSAWNDINDYQDAALHLSLKYFKDEVSWDLIHRPEVDVEQSNDAHWTPFLLAVVGGNLDIVRYLREGRGANDHARNNVGEAALHRAIQHNHNHVAVYLVETCQHEIEPTDMHGWTPLHFSVLLGNLEGFDYLISKGADPLRLTGEELSVREINRRTKHTSSKTKEAFSLKFQAFCPPEAPPVERQEL